MRVFASSSSSGAHHGAVSKDRKCKMEMGMEMGMGVGANGALFRRGFSEWRVFSVEHGVMLRDTGRPEQTQNVVARDRRASSKRRYTAPGPLE